MIEGRDMSTPSNHFNEIGDYVASFTASLVVVSQWSQVLTPIVALLVGVATLVWWCIRLWDRLVNGAEKQ